MGRIFGRRLGAVLGMALLAGACSGSSKKSGSTGDKVCEPGERSCDGATIKVCSDDGTELSTEKTCSLSCTDGECDATTGPGVCTGNICTETTCLPNTKFCQDGSVWKCDSSGVSSKLSQTCAKSQFCRVADDSASCTDQACTLGSVGCDGTRAVKCNTYGSDWDPAATDCAAENKVCVAGSCKEQTCKPNGTFCQDNAVYQCDQDGVTSTLWQPCPPSYSHCEPYPSSNYATCATNDCYNGEQSKCVGNEVRDCNADGSLADTGTPCGEDEYCEGGACKPRICEPNTIFCKDGNVYGCDWSGTYASLYQECPSDTTCKVTNGSYSCIPMPCSPGDVACLGNKVGTCAADGQSLSAVTEDCTKSASICGLDNKCAKSVVDVLGADELNGDIGEPTGYFIGDVIEVSSARKLTEMQLNLSLPPPRSLRWVVFEETSDTNFTARQDWVVANQSGSGFFSSGPISYPLKAGKTYLFGAVITGGNTFTAYLDTGPFPLNASFGTVLGRVESPYSPTMGAWVDTGYLYQMKLTTTP